MITVAFVPCSEVGCDLGLQVDIRHWDNITARDWYCPDHEEPRR